MLVNKLTQSTNTRHTPTHIDNGHKRKLYGDHQRACECLPADGGVNKRCAGTPKKCPSAKRSTISVTDQRQNMIIIVVNNNNNRRKIFIVLSSTAKPYARVHSGHLSESQSAPGGRLFLGRAANLTSDISSSTATYR